MSILMVRIQIYIIKCFFQGATLRLQKPGKIDLVYQQPVHGCLLLNYTLHTCMTYKVVKKHTLNTYPQVLKFSLTLILGDTTYTHKGRRLNGLSTVMIRSSSVAWWEEEWLAGKYVLSWQLSSHWSGVCDVRASVFIRDRQPCKVKYSK